MVNQDVLNYLNEGKKRGFSLQLLKQKLLEGGFEEREINDAIAEINKAGAPTQSSPAQKPIQSQPTQSKPVSQSSMTEKPIFQSSQPKPVTSTYTPPKQNPFAQPVFQSSSINNKKGSAHLWAKISGILGIALLVFLTIFSLVVLSLQNSLVLLFYFIIIMVFSGLYIFGFYKIGKEKESKLLKFSSLLMVIILALILVIGFVLYLTGNQLGEALSSISGTSAGGLVIVLSVLIVLLIFVFIISKILFSIGLIKLKGEVKLAKLSGIVNLIVSIIGIFTFIFFIILLFTASEFVSAFIDGLSPQAVGDSFIGAAATIILFVLSFLVLAGLKFISTIIEIVMLFKASKTL